MAATTTQTINLELTYKDYTTRTYKVPLQTGAETQAKAKIRAFNTAAENDASSVAQTFVSNDGSAVAGITAATIVYRTEEEIYHA